MSVPVSCSAPPPEDTIEDALPEYSSHSPSTTNSQLVTHSYSLTHKGGRVWLQLNAQSRASSSGQLPLVLGSQAVQGTVDFEPKGDVEPKSITIALFGELVSDQNIHFSFVEVSQELWPIAQSNSIAGSEKPDSPYVLPFSLRLPETVDALAEDKTVKSFKLPATDFARYRRYVVVYTLGVTVKYGSIFRPKHTLETHVNYIPIVQPPPPSILRQNAYMQNAPIPPPEADPEGWHTLQPITFEGKLFGDRTITIQYILSLAKPLSYTHGSVVPLHIVIECSDMHGLELASAPSAPLVRFRRISHINYDAGGSNISGHHAKLSDLKPMSMTAFHDLIDWLNTATWWSTPCEKSEARTLQGEIHIRKNVRPSTLLGLYKLSYDVAVFEPVIPGFVPINAQTDKALQSIVVEVATAYAPGPRPMVYSPPNYEDENAKQPSEALRTRFNQFNEHMFY